MRILHLSTGDNRGAFSGAYRLHQNMQKSGHDSIMFVLNKVSSDPSVITPVGLVRRIFNKYLSFSQRVLKRIQLSKEGAHHSFFSYKTTLSCSALFQQYQVRPDIIIVYYVADFLSDDDLYKIQNHYESPIVFYLMDMAPLTGGCHYAWDCVGYQKVCGNCPALNLPSENDISSNIFKKRSELYHKMNVSILSGSEWLSKRVRASQLTNSLPLFKSLIGIDHNLYRVRNRDGLLREFNLSINIDEIVIYFGAQSLSDKRKGFVHLVDALNVLSERLPLSIKDKIIILTVGKSKLEEVGSFGFKNIHVGYISDVTKFAKTYNLADVFICPSAEDAGPMMINESLMAGTPVISFNVGVALDLIVDGETGYISNEVNGASLANTIERFLLLPSEQRLKMKDQCRQKAINLCSESVQVESIEKMVEHLLSK
jgi:glycosyltransferase involved in cell wall biosynthesis